MEAAAVTSGKAGSILLAELPKPFLHEVLSICLLGL